MKKRIHISRNEKISSEYRNFNTTSNLIKANSIHIKEETKQILINHKSSLVLLFSAIKNFQSDFFSKENEYNKSNLLKKLLTLLKNNLTLMQKEKMKQFNLLKTSNETIKKRIQENLFSENENNRNYQDDLYSYYINKKNQLNLINFQIQNDIQKTNILIDIKNKIYLFMKHISFYLNLNREIYCSTNKNNSDTVSEILKNIRTSVKNEFISAAKEKMETDLEINAVKFKINFIKDNLEGNKRYIEPEEIIEEENENNGTLISNKDKRNSCASINKITFSKNVLKRPSNHLAKKHLSIDAVMEDNFYRNKLFDLFLKNNEIVNNNQINNFYNINVNINLGCIKHNHSSSSSSESEDNYESKDEQAKIEFDGIDSINESDNKTEEDIKDNNAN